MLVAGGVDSVAVHKHTSLHRWPPTQKFEEEKDAAGNIINPYGAPEAYAVLYTKCVNVDWSGRPGGVPSANGCIQSTFGAAYTYDEGTSTSSSITQPPRLFFSNNAGLGLFEVIIPAGGVLCGNQR